MEICLRYLPWAVYVGTKKTKNYILGLDWIRYFKIDFKNIFIGRCREICNTNYFCVTMSQSVFWNGRNLIYASNLYGNIKGKQSIFFRRGKERSDHFQLTNYTLASISKVNCPNIYILVYYTGCGNITKISAIT